MDQQRIHAKGRQKPFVLLQPLFPYGPLLIVKRIIGHNNLPDPGFLKHDVDVLFRRLAGKIAPVGIQVPAGRIQSQLVQYGQHTAAGLTVRAVFQKQRFPDQIRLLFFGHLPECVVLHIRKAKSLRNEVMVIQKLIHPPQQHVSKLRRIQMGMNIRYPDLIYCPVHHRLYILCRYCFHFLHILSLVSLPPEVGHVRHPDYPLFMSPW